MAKGVGEHRIGRPAGGARSGTRFPRGVRFESNLLGQAGAHHLRSPMRCQLYLKPKRVDDISRVPRQQ